MAIYQLNSGGPNKKMKTDISIEIRCCTIAYQFLINLSGYDNYVVIIIRACHMFNFEFYLLQGKVGKKMRLFISFSLFFVRFIVDSRLSD